MPVAPHLPVLPLVLAGVRLQGHVGGGEDEIGDRVGTRK